VTVFFRRQVPAGQAALQPSFAQGNIGFESQSAITHDNSVGRPLHLNGNQFSAKPSLLILITVRTSWQ
jgi:hypothetical protein